jgi:hypothetical protein
MDMSVANSWWMYLLGALVTVFVLAGSIFFLIRSLKDAKKIGMDKKKINQVILSSTIFTILPSISILIGVVALSGSLGIPLPWIRLTVIGALHYEGAAAQAVIDAFKTLGITEINNEVFVTIAVVMTLGILTGPIYCLFGFKAYDKKVLAKAKVQNDEPAEGEVKEKPKKNFGSVLFNAVFIAMISSFLAVDFAKLKNIGDASATPMTSFTPTIVIIVTFAVMGVFDFIEKKFNQKWLSSFSLGLSMIVGMAVAVLIG